MVVDYNTMRLLIEVKYREDSVITPKDAIVELALDEKTVSAIVVTKLPNDFGVLNFDTKVPIIKIPAFAFLYLLGHSEKQGYLLPAL